MSSFLEKLKESKKLNEEIKARKEHFVSRLKEYAVNNVKGFLSRQNKCAEDFKEYNEAYSTNQSPFIESILDDSDMKKCIDFACEYDYEKALDRKMQNYPQVFEDALNGNNDAFEELLENLEKVMLDNIAGKIGELVVMKSLRSNGIETTEPDFNIYDNIEKSFDSDIRMNGNHGISIKTFRLYGDIPVSWMFQFKDRNGNSGTDNHFCGDDDSVRNGEWFCGVILGTDWKRGRIVSMIPMQVLFDNRAILYEMPQIKRLCDTKRAIYWRTLRDNDFLKYSNMLLENIQREKR